MSEFYNIVLGKKNTIHKSNNVKIKPYSYVDKMIKFRNKKLTLKGDEIKYKSLIPENDDNKKINNINNENINNVNDTLKQINIEPDILLELDNHIDHLNSLLNDDNINPDDKKLIEYKLNLADLTKNDILNLIKNKAEHINNPKDIHDIKKVLNEKQLKILNEKIQTLIKTNYEGGLDDGGYNKAKELIDEPINKRINKLKDDIKKKQDILDTNNELTKIEKGNLKAIITKKNKAIEKLEQSKNKLLFDDKKLMHIIDQNEFLKSKFKKINKSKNIEQQEEQKQEEFIFKNKDDFIYNGKEFTNKQLKVIIKNNDKKYTTSNLTNKEQLIDFILKNKLKKIL